MIRTMLVLMMIMSVSMVVVGVGKTMFVCMSMARFDGLGRNGRPAPCAEPLHKEGYAQ